MTPDQRRRSSAEIREDIVRTRSELDSTVDALGKRVSPAGLFEEGWNLLRRGSAEPHGAAGLQMVKQHPLPIAMLGIGFGWLAAETAGRSAGADTRPPAGREGGGPSAGERVSEAGERASGMVRGAGESVGEMGEHALEQARDVGAQAKELGTHARERVRDVGEEARERAQRAGGRLQHGARRARSGFAHVVEENPVGIGIAAFALAVAAASAVPSTRWEDESMGPARDTALDEAKRTGLETFDEAKEVASATAESTRRAAERTEEEAGEVDRKASGGGDEGTGTGTDDASERHPLS